MRVLAFLTDPPVISAIRLYLELPPPLGAGKVLRGSEPTLLVHERHHYLHGDPSVVLPSDHPGELGLGEALVGITALDFGGSLGPVGLRGEIAYASIDVPAGLAEISGDAPWGAYLDMVW